VLNVERLANFSESAFKRIKCCVFLDYLLIFWAFVDLFRLVADVAKQVDQRKLGLLLHDCIQVKIRKS